MNTLRNPEMALVICKICKTEGTLIVTRKKMATKREFFVFYQTLSSVDEIIRRSRSLTLQRY